MVESCVLCHMGHNNRGGGGRLLIRRQTFLATHQELLRTNLRYHNEPAAALTFDAAGDQHLSTSSRDPKPTAPWRL